MAVRAQRRYAAKRRWRLSANIHSRPALSLACQARPIANRSSLTALVASNSQKKRLKASPSTGERRCVSSATTWSYGLLVAAAKRTADLLMAQSQRRIQLRRKRENNEANLRHEICLRPWGATRF